MDETVMGVRSRERQERKIKETCFQIRPLRWEGSQLVSYAVLTAGTGILSWPFYAREYQVPASHSRGMH